MRRGRRSSPAWRIAKKAALVAAALVCLRLVWVAMVRGWGPATAVVDVEIHDQHLEQLAKWTPQKTGSDSVKWKSKSDHDSINLAQSKNTGVFIDKRNNDEHVRKFVSEKYTKLSGDKTTKVHNPGKVKPSVGKDKPTPDKTPLKYRSNKNMTKALKGDKQDTNVKVQTVKSKQDKNSMFDGRHHNKTKSRNKSDSLKDRLSTLHKEVTVVTKAHRGNAISQKETKRPGTEPQSESVSDGVCQRATRWGQPYHAQISTYDLVKRANYTTDYDGAYFIPTRNASDVIKDPNLDQVTVILVPFSHADPGYGMTLESYYSQRTHATLTNMLSKLVKYPNMTFQWVETVFLNRWFQDLQSKDKQTLKKLIRRGQLEIVLGGWVMPDEASTHYVSVVDQLIEGHQWLIENLGVKPRNAWVNDPFGYSSTMPYLWKSSGIDNMVFLRIDQPLKAELMKLKSLEFNWRPYWKRDNSSDMLATLMSYTNYWIADVCGPEPKICNEFGFINTGYNPQVVEITDENVEKQSMKLYEQLRITADLYKYKTLYIGLGEDFSFTRGEDWDNLYKNYDKIMRYFDTRRDLKMKIKFGTLAEYFANVRREAKIKAETAKGSRENGEFPTLSGDFFPYTEKRNEYWTGYYTTRPLNKRFSRDIGSLLRAADIFNVMAYSMFKHYGVQYRGYTNIAQNLRIARRELGVFLHHDGITGTSLPTVIDDFEVRLMRAYTAVNEAFRSVLTSVLTKGKTHNSTLLLDGYTKKDGRSVTRNNVLDIRKNGRIVLINPLSRKRKEMVSVYVNSKTFEIDRPNKTYVPVQITTAQAGDEHIRVTFPVELPAFGVEVYNFRQRSKVNIENEVVEDQIDAMSINKTIVIKNNYLTVEFDASTGMMQKVTDRSGRVTKLDAKFYAYKASSSGAYIFGPAGPAQPLAIGQATVKVSRGKLMSEVKVIAPGIFHSVRLYNTPGLQGHSLHITNEVDMAAIDLKETEVVLRFDTDLKNGHNFYTDQNGYQLMGRETKPSMKIEANYYPISSMAVLEDDVKRLTLHSREAHGVASLEEGQLEVMLDRHSMRDDGRGLGQGYYQNVNVNSDFVIQIEYKSSPRNIDEFRYTYPTQDSTIVSDHLQNEIFIYALTESNLFSLSKLHPLKTTQFPCDVAIVGLRNLVTNDLSYNGTSLVLHRKSFECGFQSVSKHCVGKGKLTVKNLLRKLDVGIVETSLSHLDNITTLDMDADITPERMELRAFRIQV